VSRRVLVIGSGSTVDRAVKALTAAGHHANAHPVIETVLLATIAEITAALARLPADGWIAASSPAAIRHLSAAMTGDSTTPATLRGRPAAVQGPGTAAEAGSAGLTVVVEAGVHTAEGLVAAIAARTPPPGPGILVLAAERGRGVVAPALRDAGYRVDTLVVYRTQAIPAAAREPLPSDPPEVVLFTSPSAVRAYLDGEKLPAGAELIALGSTTGAELARLGLRNHRTADEFSIEGLVRMLES
jgi:uroporphyrinogen-III synthase